MGRIKPVPFRAGRASRHPSCLIYLTDHPVVTGFELESINGARSSRLQAAAARLDQPPERPYELYRIRLHLAKRPAREFPVVEMLFLPGDGRAALHQPRRPAIWIDCSDPVRGVRHWLSLTL